VSTKHGSGSPARRLPPRPHLSRLKDEARRRQLADEFADRADALFAIAREHGFASWPKLKAHIEVVRMGADERLAALLDALVPEPRADHRGGTLARARALLELDPALGGADAYIASAMGDRQALAAHLRSTPALATMPGGPRGWQPLLYACFSKVLREDPSREADFAQVVEHLLAEGADPNASFHNPDDPVGTETALYGAASVVRSPRIMRLLLEAGAKVGDEEVAYHAPAHRACLSVWLEHWPPAAQLTTALMRTLDYGDLDATRLVLAHDADPAAASRWSGRTALHQAVDRWQPLEATELLLAHGADPNKADEHGVTPYALAMRLGRAEVAARLREAGAVDELSPRDRFVAACAAADRPAVAALLAEDPSLPRQLETADHWVLAEAARAGRAEAVALMLERGFDPDKAQHGYTALHWAAFGGHADVVDSLLAHGCDPARRDPHYHSAAWGWAEHSGHDALARVLLRRAATDGHLVAAIALRDEQRVREILADDLGAANRDDGWVTPLGVAASLGRVDMMETLVASGADIQRAGGEGRTPLERALDAGHDEAAAWLRAHGAKESRPPAPSSEQTASPATID